MLFVARAERGQGLTASLLEGAVSYAFDSGAEVLEGYPYDTAGVSSQHRGHSSMFRAAGFERDGKRWFLER